MAVATEHNCSVTVSQKKRIFSPFCLVFCNLHRMGMEEIVDGKQGRILGLGSPPQGRI